METTSLGMRDLVAQLTEEREWVEETSGVITESIAAELPDTAADPDLHTMMGASVSSNIRLFVELVESGIPLREALPPPAATEYAREFVRRGKSIDSLLRAYLVGHKTFYRLWREQIESHDGPPGERARLLDEFGTETFDFIAALTQGIVERYSEERERWVRSAAAIRVELLDALLAGERLDLESTAARLNYRLDRTHLAYAIWVTQDAGAVEPTQLEHAAVEIATALGASEPLLLPKGTTLLTAWAGRRDPAEAPDQLVAELPLAPAMRVAFGSPAAGIEGFRQTYAEAMEARRVAILQGDQAADATHYRTVALEALVSQNPDAARAFCRAELGPLLSADERTRRLTRSLLCYLEEGASPRRAAHKLDVHENTVINHMRRAQDLLDRPLDDRAGERIVALRLAALLPPE